MTDPYPRRGGIHATGTEQDGGVDVDMDMDFCEVVVTAADADSLAALTRTLVEERLAACGHTIASIRSVYRWEGAVHDEPEARVALHTRSGLVEGLTARVLELHPYDVPCVIALPLVGGNPAYLAWIAEETRAP